jgi:hypothetical protein
MKKTLKILGRTVWDICEQAITGSRSFPEWKDFNATLTYSQWRREALARITENAKGGLSLITHDGKYELRAEFVGGQGWGPTLRSDHPYAENKYTRFVSSRTLDSAKGDLLLSALLYQYEMELYGEPSVDFTKFAVGRPHVEEDTASWPAFRTGNLIEMNAANAAKKTAPSEIGYIPPKADTAKKYAELAETKNEATGNSWGDLQTMQKGSNDLHAERRAALADPLTSDLLRAARKMQSADE